MLKVFKALHCCGLNHIYNLINENTHIEKLTRVLDPRETQEKKQSLKSDEGHEKSVFKHLYGLKFSQKLFRERTPFFLS